MFNFKGKKINIKSQSYIEIKSETIEELANEIQLFWINPRITDFDYPLKDSFVGEWCVQVLKLNNKMKFEEIVDLCKTDDYQPATIYHLLNFIKNVKNRNEYQSLMAPGSLCTDDFECAGCVVLGKDSSGGLNLGLGNWRGSNIGEYDVLRVKKMTEILIIN